MVMLGNLDICDPVYHHHHLHHRYYDRYKMINLVGDGTYGLVYLAYNQESKEKVNIVKL